MQTIIGNNISTAIALLLEGELVGIPTETVYGLAANALNTNAVIKIFEAKNRPHFNPLIVHTKNWDAAQEFTQNVPPIAYLLAEKFSPGPITFLLPKKANIPDLVTAGSDLVAIRIPNHPIALELLSKLDFPLAAPSANQFGYISPTNAAHVLNSLNGKIKYILDGGATQIGLESTIIGFDAAENIIVHRVGGIAIEEIEKVCGKKAIWANEIDRKKPLSSGQLKSHYAPHTELHIGNIVELSEKFKSQKIASISFSKKYELLDNIQQFILSPKGNLSEAATHLFSTLRTIDLMKVDIILVEKFPDQGLGKAINDRLHRAQAIYKT